MQTLDRPTVKDETNERNNVIERVVSVTESRRIRVLYVEGYPRYDFRFVKVMLERESEKSLGGKTVLSDPTSKNVQYGNFKGDALIFASADTDAHAAEVIAALP